MKRLPISFAAVSCVTFLTGCGESSSSSPYLPLAEAEASYGRLITAANLPTPDQSGTGDRMGLFEDASGTVWGLALSESGGAIGACAPAVLRESRVTDTLPASWSIVGAANEPTGWRGGTGALALLLRDAGGTVHWQAVRGAELSGEVACVTPQRSVALKRPLHYYRLAPQGSR